MGAGSVLRIYRAPSVGLLITIVSAARRQQNTLLFQSVLNSYGGTDFAVFSSGNNLTQWVLTMVH